MDVGRSISYVFQDPQWIKKIVIGGLLTLIPIFGALITVGYWIRVALNVSDGRELPLPEWDDFGGDFMRGLKAAVAVLIWAIPLIVLFSCGAIPFSIAGSTSNGAGSAIAILFGVGAYGIGTILAIALAFVTPIIIGRVVRSDSIAAAFEFNQIINDSRENLVPLLIIVGMSIALRFVAGVGIILCIVGVLFTSFLSLVMLSHLYGQLWRRLGIYTPTNSGASLPGTPDGQ